ncbi:hypothetical protein PVK06_046682 [Gossypium arboreum]|uniref:Uncharacterized protein n=1 Tax=Gossypium arboreum TaxID=29729 RepID=A0ABR0MBL1_GOSAR|nr:hypothetical protein PVK06_046682 [Gossypium arboreum]
MNTRTDIPAATTTAATDVFDAITAYSVVATVKFAKEAQSSTTKYAAETLSIRLNIKFLASIVSIIESCFGDIIKFAYKGLYYLLSKGYCHDESLDISTQSCNGVNGTLTARRHGRRPAANIGARYDHNNAAIAVNFFYSNFISTTIDFGREYFPSTNINASLRFPDCFGFQFLFPLNLKFQQSFRNAALSISVGLNQSPDILLSAAIATSSIACGTESKYKTAAHCFTRYGAGISIINPSHDASIILAERGDLLRLAYTHHFGRLRKISAFAEVTRRLSNNKSSLAVGVSCIMDNLTTAKTTLNDRGKLRPLLLHKIKPNSSLNISAEFNMKALDKIPRIGLALFEGIIIFGEPDSMISTLSD